MKEIKDVAPLTCKELIRTNIHYMQQVLKSIEIHLEDITHQDILLSKDWSTTNGLLNQLMDLDASIKRTSKI